MRVHLELQLEVVVVRRRRRFVLALCLGEGKLVVQIDRAQSLRALCFEAMRASRLRRWSSSPGRSTWSSSSTWLGREWGPGGR